MAEDRQETRRPELPPDLARLRALDLEAHVAAGKRAGLTREQARKHAHADLRERDMLEHAELQTPGKPLPPDVPSKDGKPGKERRTA